ncbi:hypothetical protein GCM10010399_90310 [Dactylosporangium fulvum]|uniref:Lipoprotein n=1 Tax=Dactylosporangium fulvum TaxID=53359 RepID=A0ABY5WD17_9ACTN|nr:hypothetical protein [Dactylosporangium fulvum]UWP87106.1 hypothetical protein Dfulv_23845 [Dactylosporangium fulvum]
MKTGTVRAATVAMVMLALVGCARPGAAVGDEPLPGDPGVSATAAAGTTAGPTAGTVATTGPGDGPPNHADNNAWKQRPDLTAEDNRLSEEAAGRIRTALEAQRQAGDVSPETTGATLTGLGFPADRVQVRGMSDPSVPGAAYGVRVGTRGCVIGDVRPEQVRASVTGSAAEFGCLEPFSH